MKKNKRFKWVAVFTLLFMPAVGFSQSINLDQRDSFKEAQRFLINLGFERYTEEAQKTLTTEKNIDAVSKAALEKTLSYYKQVESVREISALTYSLLNGVSCFKEQICHERDIVIKIIAQQTQSFPLISLEPFSQEATAKYKSLQGDEAIAFRVDYLESRGVERFSYEKENIAKILKYIALRQHILPTSSEETAFEQFVDSHLYEILAPNYLPGSRQQNRHFGRGLTAVFIKLSLEKQCTLCVDKLKGELSKNDVKLEQVIGANYRLKNDKIDKLIGLKSGDLALEYSSGSLAYLISMGLKPVTPEDKKIAEDNELINNYGRMPPAVMNKGYTFVKRRQQKNYIIDEDQQRILDFHKDPEANRGFSHVGLVEVKQDPKTQISLAWIWDVYPQSDRIGVVRPMTPEGFAYPELFLRIGFARYNPEKLRIKFLSQKQQRGFMPVVWISSGSKMGPHEKKPERTVPVIDNMTGHEWSSNIQKLELEALIEKTKKMSGEDWFNNETLPRVFKQVRQYIYGPNALVFAKGLVNAKSMAYCSQFVTLSYLQSINFDLQTHADQYRTLPRVAGTLLPGIMSQNLDERIIAPGGLVWQSDAFESIAQLNFSRTREKAQVEPIFGDKSIAQKYVELTSIPNLDEVVTLKEAGQEIDPEDVDSEDDED